MNAVIWPIVVNITSGIVVALLTEFSKYILNHKRLRFLLLFVCTVVLTTGAALAILLLGGRAPKARASFSHFNGGQLINDYGCPWNVLNDNPYDGNSNMTMEIEKRADSTDPYHAILSYFLGEKAQTPFCAVVSGFELRGMEPRDVSRYSGILFDCWHVGPLPRNAEFYVHMTPLRYRETGRFQCDFTQYVKSDAKSTVRLFLSEFQQPPDWPGPRRPFSRDLQHAVLVIAICATGQQGENIQGKLAIDNIRFVE